LEGTKKACRGAPWTGKLFSLTIKVRVGEDHAKRKGGEEETGRGKEMEF
jgi:hypothetical protein